MSRFRMHAFPFFFGKVGDINSSNLLVCIRIMPPTYSQR